MAQPVSSRGRGQASRNGASAAPQSSNGADPVAARPRPADLLGGINPLRLAAGAGGVLADAVRSRIPKADLDERDPDYIRDTLPALWMLASYWFRAEVRKLERVPNEGPVLLVGNHSGGTLTPDTVILALAFNTYFGVERRFYQLAHNLVLAAPGLGRLRKYGVVVANPENAERALDSGAALLVYPGGDYEVHRPSWESGKVDFGGRKGFIRLALEKDVPIVPVVSIGGQELALFLGRGERLARLLRLDRIARLKALPIAVTIPWGLTVGNPLPWMPLPAKITLEVLDPIDLRATYGDDPDAGVVYDDVMARMQAALDRLSAERRLAVIG